jgi:hypothetical protein
MRPQVVVAEDVNQQYTNDNTLGRAMCQQITTKYTQNINSLNKYFIFAAGIISLALLAK